MLSDGLKDIYVKGCIKTSRGAFEKFHSTCSSLKGWNENMKSLNVDEGFIIIEYLNGNIKIHVSVDDFFDIGPALKELPDLIGEDDYGKVKLRYGYDRWYQWFGKNKNDCGEWQKPTDPDWFREKIKGS